MSSIRLRGHENDNDFAWGSANDQLFCNISLLLISLGAFSFLFWNASVRKAWKVLSEESFTLQGKAFCSDHIFHRFGCPIHSPKVLILTKLTTMIMMSKSSKMSQGFLEKSGGCVGVSFNRVVHNQRKLRYIDICCKRRVVFSNLSVPLQSQGSLQKKNTGLFGNFSQTSRVALRVFQSASYLDMLY